jgi:hypothetical protein
MADTKISALTAAAGGLASGDEFAINDVSATASRKVAASDIKTFINGLSFLGRTQLGGDAASITVSFTAMSGFWILVGHIQGYSGGGGIAGIRPNNDSGNNYTTVSSEPQDAAHTATTSTSRMILGETAQTAARSPLFVFVNKPSSSQPAWMATLQGDGSDATATALAMIQTAARWGNTASEISSFVLEGGGTNLLSGSYLEVYGIKNS